MHSISAVSVNLAVNKIERRNIVRKVAWGVAIVFFALVLSFAAGPDSPAGTISGTVKDEKGAALDGVLVKVVNKERRIAVSVITRGGGRYAANLLFPGTYEVRADRKGFETSIKDGIRADARPSIDLVMKKQTAQAAHLTSGDVLAQFPEDPDKSLVINSCVRCHSMNDVLTRRKDRAGWQKTVNVMARKRYGDSVSQEIGRASCRERV